MGAARTEEAKTNGTMSVEKCMMMLNCWVLVGEDDCTLTTAEVSIDLLRECVCMVLERMCVGQRQW